MLYKDLKRRIAGDVEALTIEEHVKVFGNCKNFPKLLEIGSIFFRLFQQNYVFLSELCLFIYEQHFSFNQIVRWGTLIYMVKLQIDSDFFLLSAIDFEILYFFWYFRNLGGPACELLQNALLAYFSGYPTDIITRNRIN